MVERESLFVTIKEKIKKHSKLYLYPIIYCSIVSIVCAYAWYSMPINHRAGIKIIFRTIGLIPSAIFVGATTILITLLILRGLISYWLKSRYPAFFELSFFKTFARYRISPKVEKVQKSFKQRTAFTFLYGGGIVLIFSGIVLGIWISRPYITLLLSSSKIQALERKADSAQIIDNRIIIPSVLVDVPIIEGVNKSNLSRGVCHISNSAVLGEGGNCIIEGLIYLSSDGGDLRVFSAHWK